MTLPEKNIRRLNWKKNQTTLRVSLSPRHSTPSSTASLSDTSSHNPKPPLPSFHCAPPPTTRPSPLPCFRATSEKTSRSLCLPVDQREPCPSGPLSRHDKFPFPFLPADGGTRLHRIFGSGHRARVVGIRLGCRSGWPLPTSHRLEEAVDGGMVRMSEHDSAPFRPGNSYIQVSAGRRLRTLSRGTLARPPRQQLDATNYAETTSWITW